MNLKEKLSDFAGSLAMATAYTPDAYPDWSAWTYETHMADLRELWGGIRPQIKRDIAMADFINAKLQEAFSSFDAKNKNKGQEAILEIYNLDVKGLR